jgi:hypothetical protein
VKQLQVIFHIASFIARDRPLRDLRNYNIYNLYTDTS